jgi:TetR/AcrR family transcriptional regulator, acrAB operon repressor
MARRTKEEALETRSRILDAAEEVFYANGVARTSLADVALAADVTRGAIYWHFKNKSDLFDAMCQRVRLPMETMVEAIADEHEPDPVGQLRTTCRFLFKETMSNPHYRRVLDIVFHKCEFVDPADPIYIRQQEWFQQGMLNMERILGNAIAKGQLRPDLDIRLARIFFCSAVDGLLKNWLFVPGCFDLGKDADMMVDACIEALNCAPSLGKNYPV